MKYSIHSLCTLILIILVSSCTKTQYNCDDCIFFRCKVNGKEWRMNCNTQEPFGCNAYDTRYYHKTSNNFTAYIKNDEENSLIGIFGKNVREINTDYNLGANPGPIISFYLDKPYTDTCTSCYIDTSATSNIIQFTEIDTINYIVAGSFEFVGHDKCGKTVRVSDGEFRLRYTY